MPQLDCVLQIQNVNWPVLVPVNITWKAFQSIVTEKLASEPEEMVLTYHFTSFALADNAEALVTEEHFKTMITKAKVFLTGKQKPRGGKPFRVILIPTFKNSPSKTDITGKKEAGKVSHIPTHPVQWHSCDVVVRRNPRLRRPKIGRKRKRRGKCTRKKILVKYLRFLLRASTVISLSTQVMRAGSTTRVNTSRSHRKTWTDGLSGW